MAYDEDLADCVRDALAERTDFEERKMFGGLDFMVNTHMACGIIRDNLMVRLGAEGHRAALARGAGLLDFTGRPMRGMVLVAGDGLGDDEALDGWVTTAVEFALATRPSRPEKARC